MKNKLPKGYVIKEIPTEEFHRVWAKPAGKLFNDISLFYDPKKVNTRKEVEKFSKLRKTFSTESHYRIKKRIYEYL